MKIGGASGFWGESDIAVPQLLAAGVDYLVFDYLAEITLSIMARARAKDPALGYAVDFVTAAMAPNLKAIAAGGVKVISNAGGLNPEACAAALRERIAGAGLDLKVSVVTGDDLTGRAAEFADRAEMFSGAPFPPADRIASINAYLGAFPIAKALDGGADIVVTGRCVDSAVTLGACINEFGWGPEDHDRLAGGSLAGHIVECGPQASGGNFTDWRDVPDPADIGYPIAEVTETGDFTVTKPEGTGGAVTVGTVAEQMLYEIGDPAAYLLPDVICDFTGVRIEQDGPDRVRVAGAKGRGAPGDYKVSVTYADGWRLTSLWYFIGEDAARKARGFADAALKRARRKLRAANARDYDAVSVEVMGDESHYGAHARPEAAATREVTLKISVRHADPKGAGLILREATGLALSAPPGLTLYGGYRPKPSPVVRLFSFLIPKDEVAIAVDGAAFDDPAKAAEGASADRPAPAPARGGEMVEIPLIRLAWLRSGDKGDKANIGVIPRDRAYAPYLWAALTEDVVADRFAHFLEGGVERFHLPGTGAINFLLHEVLGGGGMASLRNDPQGKSYGQILGQTPIPIPKDMAEAL